MDRLSIVKTIETETMNKIIKGGKALYGARLGILMLESRFPRVIGEMGNALTWPFPVHYKIVRGASPQKVVLEGAKGLLNHFIDAAQELTTEGVDGISTNCGFLSIFQKDISAACSIPVATSSLMQYRMIQPLLPPSKQVGILTISQESLSQQHLQAAGIDSDLPVVGTNRQGEFARTILDNEESMDLELAEKDLLQASQHLIEKYPQVGAILLECTNMSPYSATIQKMTNLPVFDIYSFMLWFHAGLKPRRFQAELT